MVVDAVAQSGTRTLADHGGLIAAFVGFFLILRPSRLHRWTMGQSVTFFDNDFAGRIAQKQMQTARAVTDVASEMVNTAAFALSAVLGSAIYLASVDGWGAVALLVWLALYLGLIRYFLPRIRAQSAGRASARAMITGQVVDTITNIKTVKLFAQAGHEDQAALGAMETFRDRAIVFGRLNTWFRTSLT
ncbi:MAG: multidrug ABC transporter ATP-binding protein, partial [Pelagerythrobacter marensis]